MLPTYERCFEAYHQAREHKEWLAWQAAFDRGTPAEDRWLAWQDDACYRVQVWEAAIEARLYSERYTRRHRLDDLRELLGPEAYYQGALPPPVPLWRFQP